MLTTASTATANATAAASATAITATVESVHPNATTELLFAVEKLQQSTTTTAAAAAATINGCFSVDESFHFEVQLDEQESIAAITAAAILVFSERVRRSRLIAHESTFKQQQ